MNIKKLQISSIILLLLSLFTELSESQGWITYNDPQVVFGLSLGFTLFSLSFNVKVIRTMGIPQKPRQQSQRLAFLTAIYAFLVFGIELF